MRGFFGPFGFGCRFSPFGFWIRGPGLYPRRKEYLELKNVEEEIKDLKKEIK